MFRPTPNSDIIQTPLPILAAKNKRLLSIDFLRCLGCILVVLNHAGSIAPTTFLSYLPTFRVEMFFMIGAFMLYYMGSMQPRSIGKRLVRLLPIYWLVTAITVLIYPLMHGDTYKLDFVLRSMLLIPPPSNLTMPILYPAWTLIFEIAVSVLAIVSLLLSARYKWYIFFAAILLLALCDPFTGIKEIDYYFNDRLLSTAFGLGIAILITKGIVLPKKIAYLCIPFSVFLLVMTKESSPLTWSFPVAVLVMAIISLEDQISFIMVKPLQVIALASYSIFLIHPHIIWQFDYWLPENRSRWVILIIMIFSIIIGVIVHYKVEMPLISLVNKFLSKLPIVKNRQKSVN